MSIRALRGASWPITPDKRRRSTRSALKAFNTASNTAGDTGQASNSVLSKDGGWKAGASDMARDGTQGLGAEEHVNNHTNYLFPMGRSLPIDNIINIIIRLNSVSPVWPITETTWRTVGEVQFQNYYMPEIKTYTPNATLEVINHYLDHQNMTFDEWDQASLARRSAASTGKK